MTTHLHDPAATTFVTCESLRSLNDERLTEGEWDAFAQSVHGSAYQSWNWTRVWLEQFAGRRVPHILVFRAGREIVGIIPVVIDNLRLGLTKVRIAKPVHADFEFAPCDPCINPEYAQAVVKMLIKRLFDTEHCDVFATGPVSEQCGVASVFQQFAEKNPFVHAHAGGSRPHVTINLPDRIEAFLESLSAKERGRLVAARRMLESQSGFRFEMDDDPDTLVESVDAFVRLQAEQAMLEGRHCHFEDWPGAIEFTQRLLESEGKRGRAQHHSLHFGDRMVASHLAFRFGDFLHLRLGAYAIDARWESADLRLAALYRVIESAILDGVRQIEIDAEIAAAARIPGGAKSPMHSTVLVRASLPSRARAAVLGGWSRALDLGYYHIWHNQIARRLGLPHHELANAWIRTRL
jgi:CelD/BcsL family acetyltransferase involved in cellulose biosynthesis